MSLVYIGCGSDFEPVNKLPHIKKFIYIDSQPRSEYGWTEYVSKYFFRKNYMCEFVKGLPDGFLKINIDNTYPDVYRDCRNDRLIYHYYSLPFPWTSKIFYYHVTKKDIDMLKVELSQATHLALIGHDPDPVILECLPSRFTLVTCDTTHYSCCFSNEVDDKEPSTWREIFEKETNRRRVSEVVHLSERSDAEGITHFTNVNDFVSYISRSKE